MINGVFHTSFTVSNLDRSIAFYRDVLGLKLRGVQGGSQGYLKSITGFPDADLKIAFFAIPGSPHILELIEYVSPQGTPADIRTCNPGSAHICFRTEDIRRAYMEWQARGVQFRSPPVEITEGANKGGIAVYFSDPDGITLELYQPPQISLLGQSTVYS